MQTKSKRYIFHADATGVAGQIVHPFQEIIPVQAASALPTDGGFGSARVEGFRHREIVSFSSAYTEVVGRRTEDGVFETMAVSVVEKLNLMDVVTCDRMVGRLTGRHPGEGKIGSSTPQETAILPTGSCFEGLRIGNTYFDRLEVAPAFFCEPEHAYWTGLLRAVEKDRDKLSSLVLPAGDGRPVPLPPAGQRTDFLGFSIALGDPRPGFELGVPLRFDIPHFGMVHLGEYFCDATSRRLIMLRAELGCTVQGWVVAGDPIIDGIPYPP
jgi:hypothetical protein